MKKIASFLLLVGLAAVLAGCGTSGPLYKDHPDSKDAVPVEQSKILIFRSKAFVAGGLNAKVSLDSKEVGNLGNGSFKSFLVAPGKVKVTAEAYTPGQCHLIVNALPGKKHFIQITPNTSNSLALDIVALSKLNPDLLPCTGQFVLREGTEESSLPLLDGLGAAK